jgi:hypothetical protein
MALQIAYCSDQLQPRAYCPLRVVFMRLRIPEVDQDTVAHILRHKAAEAAHRVGNAFLIGRNDLAEIFGVHAS